LTSKVVYKYIRARVDYNLMEILQVFHIHDGEFPINIQRDSDDGLLFQASQIGKLLGLSNIRASTNDYTDFEKVVKKIDTPGGMQEVTFLTECHSIASDDSNFPRNNTQQRKVQQYDPKTLTLIKTFDGIMEVLRTYPEMSQWGIKTNALNNTVYRDYRWYLIDPDAEWIQYEIPPTVERDVKSSASQYVAKLDKDKKRIENVYISQAEAARANGIQRYQTVCDRVKSGKMYRKGKCYYMFFKDCSEELQSEFIAREQLPEMAYRDGKKISQLHPKTREVVRTFNSITDVRKHFCISHEKIKLACENGEKRKGYFWKYADDQETTIVNTDDDINITVFQSKNMI